MSKFLNYGPCPKCRSKGNDNAGDNLAYYSDGGAHCFSCGLHIFPKHYVPPQKEEVSGTKGVLPIDFSREVPSHAWEWLLQYGLPYKYWEHRVGWSEHDSRLVFTEEAFSIGRWLPRVQVALAEGARAQHSGSIPRKWFVWGDCHKTPIVLGHYSEAKEIVLVEDLISAHKLGQVGPSIALYGTNIFSSVVPCLRHIDLPVVLWLDKDQEQYMPKKAAQLAELTGLKVRYVTTKDDPKVLSFTQIKEVLQ